MNARTEIHPVVREGVPLAPLTTYRMGGAARYYAEVDERAALAELVGLAAELPVLVLGRGSNVVVSDRGHPGLVIRLGRGLGEVRLEDDGTVTAGASAPLPVVARKAAEAGRGGLEFFVGIPGSVGGAVRMNAGCHGSETVEVLLVAAVFHLATGRTERLDAQALELSYRHSNLRPDDVVAQARFRTVPSTPERSAGLLREVTRWRREHQPGGTLNAGSVFRNPPADAAGRLIEITGLKGFRVGSAAVSVKHANFFVADPGASAQDVYDLVWAVRRRVGETTGVWLEPEIQFAGPFRPSPDE